MKLNRSVAKALFGSMIIGLALWSGLVLVQRFIIEKTEAEYLHPPPRFDADSRASRCLNQARISPAEAATITNEAVLDAAVVKASQIISDERAVYRLEMNNGAEVEVDACTGDILAIRPAIKPQNQVVDTVPSLILD